MEKEINNGMLKEVIDKFYLDNQEYREQSHFYITDAGKCGRALFFKFKNVPKKEMEARILRMFDHGDYIHQLIMKSLIGARDIHIIASEIKIPAQELVSGRADAIISDGKRQYVLDIKSMNSMIFRNLTRPKEENINQIQLYLHFFEISKGILLYVSKDTQDLKEFLVDYDEKRAQNLLSGLVEIKEKIDSDIVPCRISSHPSDWQCKYCQYKAICKIAGSEEISWKKLKKEIVKKEK